MLHRQCSKMGVGDEVAVNARQRKKFAQEISVPFSGLRYPRRFGCKPGTHLLPSIASWFGVFEHAWVRDQTQTQACWSTAGRRERKR